MTPPMGLWIVASLPPALTSTFGPALTVVAASVAALTTAAPEIGTVACPCPRPSAANPDRRNGGGAWGSSAYAGTPEATSSAPVAMTMPTRREALGSTRKLMRLRSLKTFASQRRSGPFAFDGHVASSHYAHVEQSYRERAPA